MSRDKISQAVVQGLTRKPSYLLLFGLSIIGSVVATMSGFLASDMLQMISVGSFFVFLTVSSYVVYSVETTKRPIPSVIPDVDAKENYMFGAKDAHHMSGIWTIDWNDSDKVQSNVSMIANGASVFGVCADERQFWIAGRMDDEGSLSLLFWGQKNDDPHGGVFLVRETNELFKGTWKGTMGASVCHYDISLVKKG